MDNAGLVGRHAGDGVAAFFLIEHLGSESAAASACIRAARCMAAQLSGVAERSGLASDEITVRFGLHWGSTLHVGNITSAGRTEVTALGDEANEAARIEACATGGRMLASKALIERLTPDDADTLGIDLSRSLGRVEHTRLGIGSAHCRGRAAEVEARLPHRHLHFAASNDLWDIVRTDWPSVKEAVERSMYDDREPIPVPDVDLQDLVRARPTGSVSSKIDWSRIDDDGFERLVFELVRQTTGYENPNWLMRTNAPDRGRDIEVYRVIDDPLAGVRRYRAIIQCKHWRSKSVGRDDLILCVEAVKLWEKPRVDTLVVATSGRFTQGAVALKEKRDDDRDVPAIELWPDNHLELLIARRPHLAAAFGLR